MCTASQFVSVVRTKCGHYCAELPVSHIDPVYPAKQEQE